MLRSIMAVCLQIVSQYRYLLQARWGMRSRLDSILGVLDGSEKYHASLILYLMHFLVGCSF